MPTVVVTDYDFPDIEAERDVLDRTATVRGARATTPEEVIAAAEGADGLLVQYAPVTAEVFDALDSLRVVARYGIGVDNVDLDAATANGVAVTNVPDYCLDEVPEHALALALTCERKTALFTERIAEGTWDWKEGRPIDRLRGQTLGLVGFGTIPRSLVGKAESLGFEFVAYDPYVDAGEMADYGVEKVDFEGLCERSDVVSVHAPLTPDTEGLFDAGAFDRIKETATLVNTARGGIVDVDALHDALADGELAGAGLDVMPEEPPEREALFARDDVVATPHVAWYSEASISTLRRSAAEQVRTVLEGGVPEYLVNEDVRVD